MAVTLIHAPSFPQLEEQLISDLQRSQSIDPLSPIWVLTPSSTSSNGFRLKLAQGARTVPLGGVRVLPFSAFTNRLADRAFQKKGTRWGPSQDFLLMELLSEAGKKGVLPLFGESFDRFIYLRPTFLDLADGGIGSDQMEVLAELAADTGLSTLEQTTLLLYQSWVSIVEASGMTWEPLLQQALPQWILAGSNERLFEAMACEAGQVPRLCIHGFYDFTDVNLEVIAALGRRCDIDLYYPFAGGQSCHPAFSFSKPVLEDLKLRLGSSIAETRSAETADRDTTTFFLLSYPDGEVPHPPGCISFQLASGVQAEALSAAQRIRTWKDSLPGLSYENILVVAPDIDTYYGAVTEVFADFAIPLRVADLPLKAQKQANPLQQLYRVWNEGAPVDWLIAYLRDTPAIAERLRLDLAHFESAIRKLPVTAGYSWTALAEVCRMRNVEEIGETLNLTEVECECIQKVADLVSRQTAYYSPGEALGIMESMGNWLEDPAMMKPVSDAILALGPEVRISRDALQLVMESAVEEVTYSDPAERPGVLLVPLMRARGLTGTAIVLLGLSSNKFPRRIDEDPLLSDESRERLRRKAGQIGHRLPIKAHATDEMSLLFFLLNTSAERVHWVIPETDETGSGVSPNPWVLRYLQKWRNHTSARSFSDRIPRNPVEQAHYLYNLDRSQGSMLPPRFAEFLDRRLTFPRLGPEGTILEPSMRIEPRAEWHGEIPSAALSAKRSGQRISVTRLETLARCPFRFWASHLVQLEALTPAESREELDPLTWGKIVHRALENAFRPYNRDPENLKSRACQLLGRGADRLENQIRSAMRDSEVEFLLRPAVFRVAAEARLRETIHSYLRAIVEGKCSDGIPLEAEVKAVGSIRELGSVVLSGQLDQIVRGDNQSIRIVDYKSGQPRWGSKRARRQSLLLGFFLQPLLYPLLYKSQAELEEDPEFCFIFLGEQPPVEDFIEPDSYPPGLIESLSVLLRKGYFFPTSNQAIEEEGFDAVEPCQYCDLYSLCRRFELGRSTMSMNFLRKRVPERYSGQEREHE